MHRFAPPDHGEMGIKPEELRSALREWQKSVLLWPVEVVRSFKSALPILGVQGLSGSQPSPRASQILLTCPIHIFVTDIKRLAQGQGKF